MIFQGISSPIFHENEVRKYEKLKYFICCLRDLFLFLPSAQPQGLGMQIFEHRDGGRIKIGSGSGLTQYILSLMYGTVHEKDIIIQSMMA